MDGPLKLNDLLDTPPICNRSIRISAFENEHAQLAHTVHVYTVYTLNFAEYPIGLQLRGGTQLACL